MLGGCSGYNYRDNPEAPSLGRWPLSPRIEDVPPSSTTLRRPKRRNSTDLPIPPSHKIFWFEYPDLESITEAAAELAGSGIGVALNIGGDYNAMMCSYTIAEANKRSQKRFFRFQRLHGYRRLYVRKAVRL